MQEDRDMLLTADTSDPKWRDEVLSQIAGLVHRASDPVLAYVAGLADGIVLAGGDSGRTGDHDQRAS